MIVTLAFAGLALGAGNASTNVPAPTATATAVSEGTAVITRPVGIPGRKALIPTPTGDSGGNAYSLTEDDGYFPDGVTLSPFETEHPAVTNLDPELLAALRAAATDADAEGIEMVVNSGWRSERYQQTLLDEAILTYGSEEEALKWVNSPGKSTHVSGDAVDIGFTDADYWLIEFGFNYGLCQTYDNEIWHFELAVEPGETCPPPLTDPTVG